ncbi:MAG TPA: DUF3106 domain-containing protein [Burkholderiaceae bacterium]|nr:DUF3106 domain-containing protein [Burkholderiaceae bacterium]
MIAAFAFFGAAIFISSPQTTYARSGPAPTATARPTWSELTPAQRQALAPLQNDWDGLDAERKRKWLEISARMPNMQPAERERVQQRMRDWAAMSPKERQEARRNYRELKKTPPDQRQRAWEQYQQLPEDERKRLAEEARRNQEKERTKRKPAHPTNSEISR